MAGVEPSLSSEPDPDAIPITPPETEALWRGILLGTDKRYRESYTFLRRLPGAPRCRFCSAPFKGPGAVVARRMGRRPWAKNPHYCETCFVLLENQHGGAEIDCSLMFAATGHGDPAGAWLPIGIGVHTGVAYVGAVGAGPSTTITALGDTVNVAARLASAAGSGELLLSMDAARAAKIEGDSGERRDLELKGKSERVPVLVLGAT